MIHQRRASIGPPYRKATVITKNSKAQRILRATINIVLPTIFAMLALASFGFLVLKDRQ